MTPIRLHFALILDTSACLDPERAVKQFLATAEFADVEKSVEVVSGQYVVRYTVDGPETLTALRRALKHMAKALFSEATQTAIRNLTERPSDFNIEMNIRLPVYGMEDV
jgi:hypothetical protein